MRDRYSFCHFLNLSPKEPVPDAHTVWLFRERLKEHDLVECLFDQLLQQIKGETPEGWEDKPDAFLRQKDVDARWTKKNAVNYYGYKNHVSVDNKNKLVRRYQITSASVHDSQVFDEILDPENTNAYVWADSAYRSADQEASLTENGYRSHIYKKGKRYKPLSKAAKAANRRRSTVRSRVEHVFGAMEAMGGMVVRTIGRAQASAKIGLMNVAYNVKRFAYLQEQQARE